MNIASDASLSEPMRVGYVLKRYPRFSETFVVNEILAHEAAGLAIEIFSLYPPNDEHFQDAIARVQAPVHYLVAEGSPKTLDFWAALQDAGELLPEFWRMLGSAQGEQARDVYMAVLLGCQVRRRTITHLHAHFASAATTVARLASRFADVPYSFTAHAKDIFQQDVQPEALRMKLSDAATVITVSDYNVEYLRKAFGPAAARVERIYNGLDLQEFPYEAPANRAPRLVAVGRLIEKKGFADLIDACAILATRTPSFHCQIIGTGPLEADLHMRIARHDLIRCVDLLGPRPRHEVIEHIRKAAVLVAPSVVAGDGNRDGLPTVLLEAMALGTTCVSTELAGIPEAVRHGETGLLVPQHDPAALARAIEQLLVDPALRVRLATSARRLIESEFDVHRNTTRLRSTFQAAQRPGVASMQVAR